ncbi:MAG TPA: membrane dipeptidase [Candidatus Limnocylindria bacterium]|nr:membrane dipeptidase [Candidatus Limnocylindria bacterium]
MSEKVGAGYRSFSYLRSEEDFRYIPLAKDLDRVPSKSVELSESEERRARAILDREPIVSMHDHTSIFPEDMSRVFEYRRQGRDWTGYAGLARSDTDVFFENFMDGTALITSNKGWKWDDILFDIGMRYSDLAHSELIYPVQRFDDLLAAKATRRIAFVPWLEAATAIENEIDRVDVLYGFGIRGMGITYSEANALGSGLRETHDSGLSDLGRAVVKRMNRLGMTIDISHCGDRTGLETIEASDAPITITHAGARSLWNTRRMKTDETIKRCAEKGGVIGIEAAPHTTLTAKHPRHSIDSVMEHVEYCVGLVGVDHVGLGPDTLFGDHLALHHAFAQQLSLAAIREGPKFDEVPYVDGMENPGEAMRNAVRWLVHHGHSDADVAKIAGGNALRVLKETWLR